MVYRFLTFSFFFFFLKKKDVSFFQSLIYIHSFNFVQSFFLSFFQKSKMKNKKKDKLILVAKTWARFADLKARKDRNVEP